MHSNEQNKNETIFPFDRLRTHAHSSLIELKVRHADIELNKFGAWMISFVDRGINNIFIKKMYSSNLI